MSAADRDRPERDIDSLSPTAQAAYERIATLLGDAPAGDPRRLLREAHGALSRLDPATQRAVARALATSHGDLGAIREALRGDHARARGTTAARTPTVVEGRRGWSSALAALAVAAAAAAVALLALRVAQ